MSSPTVLIAGCGDLGTRLGLKLATQTWRVYGLRRHTECLPPEIHPIRADLNDPDRPNQWPTTPVDYLVYAAAADQHHEAAYRQAYVQGLEHILRWTLPHRLRGLIFVSSTSVYSQNDGTWVDEDSATQPDSFSGRLLLEAEQLALHSGHPTTCIRLAGLYGTGRTRLIQQVQQGHQIPSEPPQYSNRIHVEDAAELLAHGLQQAHQGQKLHPCYLGVDDEPAPLHQVMAWLADQLQVPLTNLQPSRRLGSKRCSNARARALGWTPKYPSYRQGYEALLSSDGYRR